MGQASPIVPMGQVPQLVPEHEGQLGVGHAFDQGAGQTQHVGFVLGDAVHGCRVHLRVLSDEHLQRFVEVELLSGGIQ